MTLNDSVLGKKFPVLNAGHIVLMDVMGSDQAILEAARTSYQGGISKRSDDRTLLRYLFRHQHATPFESCTLKFHVKLPIFVERQWARHRTAGWNEVSARYSVLPEEFYVPNKEAVAAQSTSNKQGRGEAVDDGLAVKFQKETEEYARSEFDLYHRRLDAGIARELARINLPLGTYTEKVWWINLRNLLHFVDLRSDKHAQLEIREFSHTIGEILSHVFPMTWEAFLDYQFNAVTLSALDVSVISKLTSMLDQGVSVPVESSLFRTAPMYRSCLPAEWLNSIDEKGRCREFDEFVEKAARLGIVVAPSEG